MWNQRKQEAAAGLVLGKTSYDPARPSLLMVHGAGGRGEGFLPQLSGLSRDLNVAAIDLPGHGGSPGPGRDSVEAYADWLAGFLESGPVRPVLLGHSMGGAVIMSLAIKRPELARGLILAGSGSRLKVMPAILEGIAKDFRATVGMIVRFAYAEKADPRLIDQGVEQMAQVGPEVLLGDFTACDRYDLSDSLVRIKHRVQLIVGQEDRLTPVKYSQRLAEALPGSRMTVIKDAGHMVYLEQPRVFNETVLEFMGGF